ncbi:hypothetical protein BD769DRAFT_1668068 [Suillus cothurnatus]|nr:hypothetical protein BD769DRAFT_1668068 [Suillus cothurnatus]
MIVIRTFGYATIAIRIFGYDTYSILKYRAILGKGAQHPPSPVVKPVKAKEISTGKVPRTKTVPPPPDATIQTTCSDSSVKNGLSSKLKHQHTFADDSEEDRNESDNNADLQPEKSPAIYRPHKLCRTFAMRDVSALFESDDDQPEGDSVTNGNYSDTDHEESEGEEPEATAMMLSDEISDSKTNVSLKSKQSHGKTQSAWDAKQAAEIPTWCNFDNAVSEFVDETTTGCGEDSEPYSSDVECAQKLNSAWAQSAQSAASLI